MKWNTRTVDRLFELYVKYFERLCTGISAANESFGSGQLRKPKLERLTRDEFESLLCNDSADLEARNSWLLRIVRGHEAEFPELSGFVAFRQIAG
jgi:hypothetical protein